MSKNITRLATISAVTFAAMAPVAGAYSIPTPPTTTHQSGVAAGASAKAGASSVSGLTASGLASKGSVSFTVTFPSAGTMVCTILHSGTPLGTGSKSSTAAGSATLTVTLTSSGKTFLNSKSKTSVTLTVACKFTPTSGTPSTSTSVVKTSVKVGSVTINPNKPYGGLTGKKVGPGGGYIKIPGTKPPLYVGAQGQIKTAKQAGIK